jgi:WD40 repeat protein
MSQLSRRTRRQLGTLRSGPNKRYDAFISYAQAADGRLTPALRDAMQQMGKRWNQRRALEVFGDQTGLSATPELWTTIRGILDRSEWLVLLASPEAAVSHWVGREVEHWISTKGVDRLLLVLTDGAWCWDEARNDFCWDGSTDLVAIPPPLRNAFSEEPRHIDMSWLDESSELTLRNTEFRRQVAEIASPIHRMARDELDSEDIRQQRRTLRLARAAIAALATLTAFALLSTAVAISNQREADEQRARAVEQRDQARSAALAAEARETFATRPDLASLLALASLAMRFTPASLGVVQNLLTQGMHTSRVLGGDADTLAVHYRNDHEIWVVREDGAVEARPVDGRNQGGTVVVPGNMKGVTCCDFETTAFSPDGRYIATTRPDDPAVRLWDAQTRNSVTLPLEAFTPVDGGPGRVPNVTGLAYDPSGRALATTELDGTIRFWNTATGLPARESINIGGLQILSSPAFSPDGRQLATLMNGESALLWDLDTGAKIGPFGGMATALTFRPDGRQLATTSSDFSIQRWDTRDGTPVGPAMTGHKGMVAQLAYRPDGTQLASASNDETIRIWDAETGSAIGEPLAGSGAYVSTIAYRPDGTELASVGQDGAVRIWLVEENRPLGHIAAFARTFPPSEFGFLANGQEVATADTSLAGEFVQIWHASTATPALRPGPGQASPADDYLMPGKLSIHFVTRRTDRHLLALEREPDQAFRLWDLDDERIVAGPFDLKLENERVRPLFALSSDGRQLAVAEGQRVTLWDLRAGTPDGIEPLEHNSPVLSLAYRPDSGQLTTSQEDGTLSRWDTASGHPIPTSWRSDLGPVTGLTYGPDGTWLRGSIAGHAEVLTWTTETESPAVTHFATPDRQVLSDLALNPTDDQVAVVFTRVHPLAGTHGDSGESGEAVGASFQFWSLDAGRPLAPSLPAAVDAVSAIAYDPNGHQVITASLNAEVRLWLEPGGWIEATCRRAGQNLSQDEWTTHLGPDVPYRRLCTDYPTGPGADPSAPPANYPDLRRAVP